MLFDFLNALSSMASHSRLPVHKGTRRKERSVFIFLCVCVEESIKKKKNQHHCGSSPLFSIYPITSFLSWPHLELVPNVWAGGEVQGEKGGGGGVEGRPVRHPRPGDGCCRCRRVPETERDPASRRPGFSFRSRSRTRGLSLARLYSTSLYYGRPGLAALANMLH